MSVSYIPLVRAKDALRSSYDGSDDSILLDDLIPACSAFLDRHCNRSSGGLTTSTFDELYHGTGDNVLFLRNTPVQSISRIATITLPCLSVHNTDPDMGCRATVQINGTSVNPQNLNCQNTSTGMTLTYVKNAVTTTNTLTWVSYPTITQLVTAINGLGNNWTAQTMGGFDTWSSTDLRATQGAFGARVVTAYFWIHWMDLPWYRITNENTGEIYSPMGFARGQDNWRVTYTAGYTTFPDDLSQALAELVAMCYYSRELHPSLNSESLGGYSYSRVSEAFAGLSDISRKTINRYRIPTIGHFSSW